MARQARRESKSGYYHVMMRGINREFVFQKDADKTYFMRLMVEQQEDAFELLAWCVMDNHVHMVIKAEKVALSKVIKTVSVKFAAHYNRSQKRIGPVFGERFRSETIEDNAYLLGVLRYIHRNPVRARLVKEITEYRWSSAREYFGPSHAINLGLKANTLELFGGDLERFARFHLQDDETEYLDTKAEAQQNRDARATSMIEHFCQEYGVVDAREIKRSPERFSIICRRLVHEAGLTMRKAAEHLASSHQKVCDALKD